MKCSQFLRDAITIIVFRTELNDCPNPTVVILHKLKSEPCLVTVLHMARRVPRGWIG